MNERTLTINNLKSAASAFAYMLGAKDIPDLFGVTDGKAVGTYIERAFKGHLAQNFDYQVSSFASGIDFPALEVDLKVTSIRQPQSSCPFQSAQQKVYGLGYHLLIFVYDKHDNPSRQTARLEFKHCLFIHKDHTADYQTTRGLLDILQRDGNIDDITAFLEERHLPLDDVGRLQLAGQIMQHPPKQGYVTISNALQWRLQYSRAISLAEAGTTEGVDNLLKG